MTEAAGSCYSIAAVSKLTGISCHALRVWERRYGFPVPSRSESGHRRYDIAQVGELRELAALAQGGRPIGELIGELKAAPPLDGLLEPAAARRPPTVVVDLLFDGDLVGAGAVLDRFHDRMEPLELIEEVIEPALVEIGERWYRGESEVFQQQAAIGCLFVALNRLLDRVSRQNMQPRRRVLVGSVAGDRHEGGVLMISLALELAGWRAIPIGVDMPVREYHKAVEAWRPDALALSFVLSRNINKRFAELARIASAPVFVGGRSIVNHQGLARRAGLIPLPGSVATASRQLMVEVERWHQGRGRAGACDLAAGPPRDKAQAVRN